MISTELSSQVLGYKVESVTTVNSRDINQLLVLGEKTVEINVYELAFKCKEWAYKQDEKYTSFLTGRDTKYDFKRYFAYFPMILDRDGYEKQFRADSEPDAIFKACQWILDNKEIK